jgi:hypothetical protein
MGSLVGAVRPPEGHTAKQLPGEGEEPGHGFAVAGLRPEKPGSVRTGWLVAAY